VPVFRLREEPLFPSPRLASPEGLLAVGGDLSVPRLLLAYSMGIFPWFNEGDPPLWWSPDPRCILPPSEFHLSRSLKKLLRRTPFEIRVNSAFEQVVSACAAAPRRQGGGTWITDEMKRAYLELHRQGYAQSLECCRDGRLVGGIYGVSLGRFFFGESMFSFESGASKAAMHALCERMAALDYLLLDCQMPTAHLESLGAKEIARKAFLERLRRGGLEPSTRPSPGPRLG